jgi:hypothetical protein
MAESVRRRSWGAVRQISISGSSIAHCVSGCRACALFRVALMDAPALGRQVRNRLPWDGAKGPGGRSLLRRSRQSGEGCTRDAGRPSCDDPTVFVLAGQDGTGVDAVAIAD